MTRRAAPTATTRVAGVIGDPVRHSFSPILQNAAFEAMGLDWTYVAFPVAAGRVGEALTAMKVFGVEGLSVTMPHKTDVARLADEASDDVVALDAANTLVRVGDRVRAEVTDGDGCLAALREGGCEPSGLRIVLLGAGGAGRAVALALGRAGAASVTVVNRDDGRADQAVRLCGGVGRRGVLEDVKDADLIVHATPVGMGSDPASPIPTSFMSRGQVVMDLIYHPIRTPLIDAATASGATTVGGLGMLIHQAVIQIRLWTGLDAPVAVMQAAAERELAARAAR